MNKIPGKSIGVAFLLIALGHLFLTHEMSGQTWCRSNCNLGTGFNGIENCGTLTMTGNRQQTNKTTSCSANTEHALFWTFTGVAGMTYVFDFGSMGVNGLTDNRIRIYNGPCPNGVLMTSSTNNVIDNNNYVEWTCSANGTYYVLCTYSSCTGNFSTCQQIHLGYYHLDKSSCTGSNYFDN